MALEKATITNVDTNDEIEVLFNPKEYVIEKKTPWSEINVFGMDSPPVQFTMGERKRLSMELFFDTSEEKRGFGLFKMPPKYFSYKLDILVNLIVLS